MRDSGKNYKKDSERQWETLLGDKEQWWKTGRVIEWQGQISKCERQRRECVFVWVRCVRETIERAWETRKGNWKTVRAREWKTRREANERDKGKWQRKVAKARDKGKRQKARGKKNRQRGTRRDNKQQTMRDNERQGETRRDKERQEERESMQDKGEWRERQRQQVIDNVSKVTIQPHPQPNQSQCPVTTMDKERDKEQEILQENERQWQTASESQQVTKRDGERQGETTKMRLAGTNMDK